jgi:pyruvate formate lyase activating enzyme
MDDNVLVTDLQRFCVNDGPGFRTNVYLKGCLLRCQWCHNPEAMATHRELYWKRRLCAQCGACLEACPRDAINPPIPVAEAQQEGSTYHKIIRERCDLCMKCVDVCIYGALEIVGKSMSVKEILDEVERDRPFYDSSGGGMTLTGGEPATHAEFAVTLLKEAKRRGLHVCLDTSGLCAWAVLKRLADTTDIVLFDVKHLDSALHKEATGAGNEVILDNLARLADSGTEVWIRIPVIPNYNDSMAFHSRAAGFLASLGPGITRVDLLPFHNWCQDKYGWLNRPWALSSCEALDPAFLEIFADVYRSAGFLSTVGGSGFESRKAAVNL